MHQDIKYDTFLSHSSKDKKAVLEIYRQLTSRRITSFFDAVSGEAGGSWLDILPTAIECSASVAFFFGPTGPSPYLLEELNFAIQRQGRMAHESGRPDMVFTMIPVLLDGTQDDTWVKAQQQYPRLRWLEGRFKVDLRKGPTFAQEFEKLVQAIQQSAIASGNVLQQQGGRMTFTNQPPRREVPRDLVNLCDRRPQTDKVTTELELASTETTPRPRVFLVEGPYEQLLHRFVDRLWSDTLPACLPERNIGPLVTHEFPDVEGTADEFVAKTARRFLEGVEQSSSGSVDRCVEILNQRQTCTVVRTFCPKSLWTSAAVSRLKEFIGFYNGPAFSRLRELLVVCVCLERPSPTESPGTWMQRIRGWFRSPPADPRSSLANLQPDAFAGLRLIHLPELGDVFESDVKRWADRRQVLQCYPGLADRPEFMAVLQSWPTHGDEHAVPMNQASIDLEKLLNRIS